MGRELILETTFLIDLERELRGGEARQALSLLDRQRDASLFITFTVAGELAAGASMSDRSAWERFIAGFVVLPASRDVCWHYGRLYRHLQRIGLPIGANDLWIASTAVAHSMPVVTRNEEHFRRIPDLDVVSYAE